MCQQAVQRFGMPIRETFSNTIFFPVTSGYDKGTVMQISRVLGNVYHIAYRSIVSSGTF